jgi:hypothetical protein
MEQLKKERTRILSLSGTPFNLLDTYEEGEIYTWDYVMEQRAKQEWDDKHFGDPNPYADLPRMQILTFTLPKMVRDQAIENNEVFRFHEFFRVWTEEDKNAIQRLIDNESNPVKIGELKERLRNIKVNHFIHENAVKSFLDKLVEDSDTSQYPFSTDEFRDNFRHTFWLLPGVKEATALEKLLNEHDVFGLENGMFKIINVAGDGNIEDKYGKALKEVENHIRGNARENITKKDYTITLSCGKLTTGVSVPEWTAVLCMKGSENTPASGYMQTIFRVQTHAVLEGRQKSDCYVFDFAPDRALTAVAETAKMAVYAQTEKGKKQMMNLNLWWFMQTLIDRNDRMSSCCGLEVRVPFCDYRIVEYLYGVPWAFMDHKGREKGLLRHAVRDILPDAILFRKKSPYPKTHHPDYAEAVIKRLEAVLEDAQAPLFALIDRSAVLRMLEGNFTTPWYGQLMQLPQTIVYLLQINAWMKNYSVQIR